MGYLPNDQTNGVPADIHEIDNPPTEGVFRIPNEIATTLNSFANRRRTSSLFILSEKRGENVINTQRKRNGKTTL